MNEAYFAMRMLADEETEKIIDHYFNTYFVFIVAMLAASDMGTTAGTAASPLSDQVEKWRPMVTQYCTKYKIPGYVDLALALMQVESSGNEPDPMQAAEGAYGLYCLKQKIIVVDIAIVRTGFHPDMENVPSMQECRN